MDFSIELTDLHKSFGQKRAVDGLSLRIPRGALYGVIGPNGAGKSTTLRMILSILFPDSGTIRVLGRDSALEAKDRIGYLPEERGVYRKMKVAEFLRYMGVLKGVERAEARRRVDQWLERVGLADVGKKKCEELSRGMQQKVQFITAVLHEPELLILDEPFSGLDPVATRLLRELIAEQHQRGTTILFSTHVMAQAEELCEHIVMIHNGHKVLDDPLSAIRARHAPRALRLEPIDAGLDVAAALRELPGQAGIEHDAGSWLIRFAGGADAGALAQAVAARVAPARLELVRPKLEDIFIEIVGDAHEASEEVA
ncbi:MAG: ATP-binding cassette domain-containing protein [Xanthomonadales bacterium]|nr:ATP-binding cassette domain-containing protein [Xanthomonadales bacterium]